MQFGPMFKIMYKMAVDLIKFLVVWVMVLLLFSCVSLLIFGQADGFKDFFQVVVFYFQASLGEFEKEAYNAYATAEDKKNDKPIKAIRLVGMWFLVFFLLTNMIIMLNFVIAILGNTF